MGKAMIYCPKANALISLGLSLKGLSLLLGHALVALTHSRCVPTPIMSI